MTKIKWNKRRSIRRGKVADFYRRYDKSRRWCVCETESHFGLSRSVLAIRVDRDGERIIYRHRKPIAAMKAIEKAARIG